MRARNQQSGSAIVGILLAVVVLAVIGFVGWRVYQQHHNNKTDTTANSASSSESSSVNNVSTAPAVNSTSDLDKSLNTIDQNDPASADNSDSSQLDAQTNF